METSWWEQRHWGITLGMEALRLGMASEPSGAAAKLHDAIHQGFQELQPKVPDATADGFKEAQAQ